MLDQIYNRNDLTQIITEYGDFIRKRTNIIAYFSLNEYQLPVQSELRQAHYCKRSQKEIDLYVEQEGVYHIGELKRFKPKQFLEGIPWSLSRCIAINKLEEIYGKNPCISIKEATKRFMYELCLVANPATVEKIIYAFFRFFPDGYYIYGIDKDSGYPNGQIYKILPCENFF